MVQVEWGYERRGHRGGHRKGHAVSLHPLPVTDQEILEAEKLIARMRDDLSHIAGLTDPDKLADLAKRVMGSSEQLLHFFTPFDGRYVPQGHYFDQMADGLIAIIVITERCNVIPEYKDKLIAAVEKNVPVAISALDKIARALAETKTAPHP